MTPIDSPGPEDACPDCGADQAELCTCFCPDCGADDHFGCCPVCGASTDYDCVCDTGGRR